MHLTNANRDAKDLVNGEQPPRPSSAGSAAGRNAAERDAGQRQVERGPSGVPLTLWSLRPRLTELEIARLKRLIPIWDGDLDDGDFILCGLYRALQGERLRGRQGKWSYDINRHTALWRWIKRLWSERMRAVTRHTEEVDVMMAGRESYRRGESLEQAQGAYVQGDQRRDLVAVGWEWGREIERNADELRRKWRGAA